MKGFEGYTGKMFESEVLSRLSDSWRREGYFNMSKSYEWVRNNQIWNPSDPDNKTASDLHFKIAEKLGLENVNELKFYSALNSPLDYHYGVDAFFEIGDSVVTIDLSLNPHKEVAKADIVVHENDLLDEQGIDALATTISTYIQSGKAEVNRLGEAA